MKEKISVLIGTIVVVSFFLIFLISISRISYGGAQCLKYGYPDIKMGANLDIYCIRIENATQVVRPLSELMAER